MLGAIIGDIVGSRWEFNPTNDYNFEWLSDKNSYTDDTICTIGVADALLKGRKFGESIHDWCRRYPHPMGAMVVGSPNGCAVRIPYPIIHSVMVLFALHPSSLATWHSSNKFGSALAARSFQQFLDLFLNSVGQQSCQMSHHALIGFLWSPVCQTSLSANQPLWRCQQRPSEAIFPSVLVNGIDKILGHDMGAHL